MTVVTRDLSVELSALIRAHSPSQADKWDYIFFERCNVWDTNNPPAPTEQIKILTRFWQTQIGMLRTDTVRIRKCIVESHCPDIWMDNFKRYVLPYILKYSEVPNGQWTLPLQQE